MNIEDAKKLTLFEFEVIRLLNLILKAVTIDD
jgi:hypothetical protein